MMNFVQVIWKKGEVKDVAKKVEKRAENSVEKLPAERMLYLGMDRPVTQRSPKDVIKSERREDGSRAPGFST